MMTYKEINEFLMSFNTTSYNRSQIGNSKQIIISVYEFLNKLNLSKKNIDIIITNIAYLNKDEINIALYLELLSKSIGFATSYDLREVIKVVKEIHDIYYKSSTEILLEEYLHDTNESRIKKLFLNRNNKYLMKNFETETALSYLADLKLACAICLSTKEYKEFISYLNNFEVYKDSYSPLLVFKTYNKIRTNIKEEKRLFWDILFGNEYTVALVKHNMPINEIFKKNIYSNYKGKKKPSSKQMSVQLDLFSYIEEIDEEDIVNIEENIKSFQLCTIYNSNDLPEFNKEKDLILYYEKLLSSKDMIVLPKLKNQKVVSYQYELN